MSEKCRLILSALDPYGWEAKGPLRNKWTRFYRCADGVGRIV